MSGSGLIMDDFLEVVESLPQEVRAAFHAMGERERALETLHKSITKHRQKILHAIRDPGFDIENAGAGMMRKMIEKLDRDEKRAEVLIGEKIETCRGILSAMETYLPVLSQEIQKTNVGVSSGLVYPQPRQAPFSKSLSSSPLRTIRKPTPEYPKTPSPVPTTPLHNKRIKQSKQE